jgi:hypothetical protein
MATARPTRRLRPTKDNRQQAVDLIAQGLQETEGRFKEAADEMAQTIGQLAADPQTHPSSLAVGAGMLFFHATGAACSQVLKGESGWGQLRDAFSTMYWGWEVGQHQWMREQTPFTAGTGEELDLIQFHLMALAGNALEIADWVAAFMFNQVSAGGIDEGIKETDFLEFYWRLLLAQVDGAWVDISKVSDEIGVYRPLLETAGDQRAFQAALVDYCDFRLSRAFQFDHPGAKRPRNASDPMYIFETQWIALLPLELLALRAVYRRTSGKELSLQADHPLLKTRLMNFPTELQLSSTQTTNELRRYGQRIFGNDWHPLTRVALRDAP